MEELSGKISDRIRSGEIQAEINPERGSTRADDAEVQKSAKHAEGHKLSGRDKK